MLSRPLLALAAAVVLVAAPAASAHPDPFDPDAALGPNPPYLSADAGGVNVAPAWAAGLTGAGTVVAVIDSGAALDHPELAPNLWTNPGDPADGIDNDRDGFVDDVHGADFAHGDGDPDDETGHGTKVAGAIVAAADSMPATGIAPAAKVMVLKVVADDGYAPGSTTVKAIDYAIGHGASIINISMGGEASPAWLDDALARARAAGVLVVVSAGNEETDIDSTPHAPASSTAPNLVTVAGLDRTGALAPWSNRGARDVDLAAPGEDVLTPAIAYSGAATDVLFAGTSAAAPLVAGAAALIHERAPALDPSMVRLLLMRTARPNPSLVGTTASGGHLDIGAAVAGLPADLTPPTVPAIAGGRVRRDRQGFVTTALRRSNDAGGPVGYRLVIDGRIVKTLPAGAATARFRLAGSAVHRVSVIATDPTGNEARSTTALVRALAAVRRAPARAARTAPRRTR